MTSSLFIDDDGVLRFHPDAPRWWPTTGMTRLRAAALRLPQNTTHLCRRIAGGSGTTLNVTLDDLLVKPSLQNDTIYEADHALVRSQTGDLWRPRPVYAPLADVCAAMCSRGYALEEVMPLGLLASQAVESPFLTLQRSPLLVALDVAVADCVHWHTLEYMACGADKEVADTAFLRCIDERVPVRLAPGGDPYGLPTNCHSGVCAPRDSLNAWWLRVLQQTKPAMGQSLLGQLARQFDCERFVALQSSNCACTPSMGSYMPSAPSVYARNIVGCIVGDGDPASAILRQAGLRNRLSGLGYNTDNVEHAVRVFRCAAAGLPMFEESCTHGLAHCKVGPLLCPPHLTTMRETCLIDHECTRSSIAEGSDAHDWLRSRQPPGWSRLPPHGPGYAFTNESFLVRHGTSWLKADLAAVGRRLHDDFLARGSVRSGRREITLGAEDGLVIDAASPWQGGFMPGIAIDSQSGLKLTFRIPSDEAVLR